MKKSVMDRKNQQPIKVFARQRPFSQSEIDSKCSSVVHNSATKELSLKKDFMMKRYSFDCVFNESSGQMEVFNTVVAPLISSVIGGYNCTVFAYGPTDTGKSHTIFGEQKLVLQPDLKKDLTVGFIPRAAERLFLELSKENVKTEYTVQVSFYEIYNEEVHDLLSEYTSLRVYDDPMNKGTVCIRDLSKVTVFNTGDVNNWLVIGQKERDSAHAELNIDASRTHTIFTFLVNVRELTGKGDEIIKTGKLQLIALAGSENTKTSGERIRDAASINRSIVAVGKVIKALALKMLHIPYRDSKLTRILQDSLAGPSRTSMVVTFSPNAGAWDDTIHCLELGHLAKTIYNSPQVNLRKKQASLLKEIQDEITKLREELAAARAGQGFYVSTETYEMMQEEVAAKNKKIIESLQQIMELEHHLKSLKTDFDRLTLSFQKTKEHMNDVQTTLREKVEINRQKEAEINDLKQDYHKLTQDANALLDICETSTKNVDVIHKKFEDKCQANVTNARIAKTIIDAAVECLRSLSNTTLVCEQHKTNHFEDIHRNLQYLQNETRESLSGIVRLKNEIHTHHHVNMSQLEELIKSNFRSFVANLYKANAENLNSLNEVSVAVADLKTQLRHRREETEKKAQQYLKKIVEALELRLNTESEVAVLLMKIKRHECGKVAQLRESLKADAELIERIQSSQRRLATEEESLLAEEAALKLSLNAVAESKGKRNDQNEEIAKRVQEANGYLEAESSASLDTSFSQVINKFDSTKDAIVAQTKNNKDRINDNVRTMTDHLERKIADDTIKGFMLESRKALDDLRNESMEIEIKNTVQIEEDLGKVVEHTVLESEDVHRVICSTLERVQQSIDGVNSTGHAGDTPVKRTYNITKIRFEQVDDSNGNN